MNICWIVGMSAGGAGKRREAERIGRENGANEAGGRGILLVVAPAQDEVQGQEVVSVLTHWWTDTYDSSWHRRSNTWTNRESCHRVQTSASANWSMMIFLSYLYSPDARTMVRFHEHNWFTLSLHDRQTDRQTEAKCDGFGSGYERGPFWTWHAHIPITWHRHPVSIRKQINIHVSRAPGVFSRVRSVSTENSSHIVRAEQLIAPMAMMLTMMTSVK